MAKKRKARAKKQCFTVRRKKDGSYTSRGRNTSKLCVCRHKSGKRGGQFKSC